MHDKQVVSNIFGECKRYPSITTESSIEAPVTPEKRKAELKERPVKKPKRETKTQTKVVKKPQNTQKPKKQTCKRTRQKAKAQPKATKKLKKPKYNVSPQREISDHELNSEYEDFLSASEMTDSSEDNENEPEWINSVFSEPVLMPRH